MRIVIALGGNALLRRSDPMTTEIQRKNVRIAAQAIVYLNWGTPEQRRLDRVTPGELASHQFAAGSMGPKVEAAARFVAKTGHLARRPRDLHRNYRDSCSPVVQFPHRGNSLN